MASPAPITRGSRTWGYLDVSRDGGRLVLATDYPQEDVFVAGAFRDAQVIIAAASDRIVGFMARMLASVAHYNGDRT